MPIPWLAHSNALQFSSGILRVTLLEVDPQSKSQHDCRSSFSITFTVQWCINSDQRFLCLKKESSSQHDSGTTVFPDGNGVFSWCSVSCLPRNHMHEGQKVLFWARLTRVSFYTFLLSLLITNSKLGLPWYFFSNNGFFFLLLHKGQLFRVHSLKFW